MGVYAIANQRETNLAPVRLRSNSLQCFLELGIKEFIWQNVDTLNCQSTKQLYFCLLNSLEDYGRKKLCSFYED